MIRKSFGIAGLGLLAGVACTDTGKLTVDSQVANVEQAQTAAASASLTLAGGTLEITKAQIAVSEIEIEGEADDVEAEMGASTINLALDGSATSVAVESVEAGKYDKLEFELRARDFGGEPASIFVTGNYEGTPFTFRSTWKPELSFKLNPPVNVPKDGAASVAISIDIGAWFTTADGAAIDPTASGSQKLIEGRVIASMGAHAEEEDEED